MKKALFQVIAEVVKALWRFIGDVLASAELQDENRRLHGSHFHGVYNYRSGRHDDGTDPYGWYGQDWSD